MIKNKFFKSTLLLLFMSLIVSCSSDDDDDVLAPDGEEYNTEVYMTDSPVDNAEVEGIFITVSEVRINGKPLEGFQKKTVEISSLTQGEKELLGNVNLEAGTTSSIVVVLDNETNASGEAPANYVLTTGGEMKTLTVADSEINLTDNAEILPSNDNDLVLDFDLRKIIVMNTNGDYSFVSQNSLSNRIRAVNTLRTGIISGTVGNMGEYNSETLLALAYPAGTYTETESIEDEDGVRFSNALNSSVVNQETGQFSMHFMEEGSYELHFISYSDEDNDGRLELEGEVEITSSTGVELPLVNVSANQTTTVDVLLSALLGL